MREAADRRGRDAGDPLGPFRGVLGHPLGKQLKRRPCMGAVRQGEFTEEERVGVGRVSQARTVRMPVPPQLVLRVVRVDRIGILVGREQAVPRPVSMQLNADI